MSWAPAYRAGWLRGDAIAGCTIWGLLIPEGIAYASLAGLPPQAGLYTLLASLALYAAFGTSRQLVVAGTSASAVLVYSSVSALHLIAHLGDASLATFAVGAVALALLFALDRVKRVPGGLAVLAAAIVVSTAFHLGRHGVDTVGQVPAGLPSVHALSLHVSDLWVLLPSAAGMMLVIFSEALGAADTFASKHGYRLDPSQEMIALGLANLGSGFLGGLAAGGSLSQSAVNDSAGARSELSPVIAAALSLVTVVALTPLFTQLPEAVLAAMIIHAVARLMRVAQMRRFYRLVRREFWLGMITLAGVITLDVLPGLLIGVVLSLLVLAYRVSRPAFSVLGASPDVPGAYEDLARHAGARALPGVLIVRPDAPLFYANAQPLRDAVRDLLDSSAGPVRTLILDLDASNYLDVTSAEALGAIAAELKAERVRLGLAHLHASAADLLRRSGAIAEDGGCAVFPTLDAAVRWTRAGQPAGR